MSKDPVRKKPSVKREKKEKLDGSSLVKIGDEYRLTPKQLKCVELLLEATPYDPMNLIAEKAGVAYQTLSTWRHHHERFQDALAAAARLKIKAEWPAMVDAGIMQAKGGDSKWAQWLSELAGYWLPTSKVEQHNSGNMTLTIEKITRMSNGKAKDAS